MPVIFPVNVPNVPGVPPVAFNPVFAAAATAIEVLTEDIITPNNAQNSWGIFQNGIPIITAESVVGFEFRKDYTLADFPIEGGSFETYDKVAVPFIAKVRFASGFSPESRANLLQTVDLASTTFATYQVVTPEFVYLTANISHYDYRRESSRGVGLIVVDVWVQQILVAAPLILQNGTVTNPSAASIISSGIVQAAALTGPQTLSLNTFGSVN